LKILKRLPPHVFWPRPKVNSAIVRLVPDAARRVLIRDREFLHDFCARVFHQRRKLIRGVLVGMYRQQVENPRLTLY
jgi:16S rRNA (adenine1518-N6/adenine1519-N6)-dimethyltransferase